MARLIEPEVVMDAGMLPSTGVLQTRGAYSTAVAVIKPRVLREVERRLLEEAALMGDEGFYGWGTGKDAIEGPGEALAFAAARCWGNSAVEYAPVVETPDAYYYTAYFIDLETGTTFGRPFRQSKKWTVYGKLDEERKSDVRFQIGATKAARNVILKAIPSWLISKAMEECKKGVREQLDTLIREKGLSAAQDAALRSLAKHGVKEDDVLRKFSVAARGALDIDRLVIIKGDLAALHRGDARASELYPPPEAAENGVKVADVLPTKPQQTQEPANNGTTATAEPVTADDESASAHLAAEAITELKALAAQRGISWDAEVVPVIGPPEEFSLPDTSADELLAAVKIEIEKLAVAKGSKPGGKKQGSGPSLFGREPGE